MSHRYPLVDIKDVSPIDTANGVTTDVRLAIGIHNDSPTTAIHWTAPPQGGFAPYTNISCDEFIYYLSGDGSISTGTEQTTVRSGHCQYLPKNMVRSVKNNSKKDNTSAVSFLIGDTNLDHLGFEFSSDIPVSQDQGLVVHVDDVTPENMSSGDGWLISDFRLPFGAHNGCSSTLFWAKFLPGAVHKKHAHEACDEIYYVISGHGLAGAGDDRVEVRGGQFHYIPKGVEHWLQNLSDTDPIEVVGIYIGAGSVAETAYVYKGDVTEDDLKMRSSA